MKIAYLDLQQGVSGELLLAALLDLDLDFEAILFQLNKINFSSLELDLQRGLQLTKEARGAKLSLNIVNPRKQIAAQELRALIQNSKLSTELKEDMLSIFKKMFKLKGELVSFEQGVEFLVYTAGILICLDRLNIAKIYASSIQLGSHPSARVLELLRGVTVFADNERASLVSELGATIISYLVHSFEGQPELILDESGYGWAKSNSSGERCLRVTLGETAKAASAYLQDRIAVLECNLDDMVGEFYEHVLDKLMASGALDVYLTPIQMKKNRPAQKLTVLLAEEDLSSILEIIFKETTTLGVRIDYKDRYKLERQLVEVEVKGEKVQLKLGYLTGELLNVAPEYEDCRQVAAKTGISLAEVYRRALSNFAMHKNE
ncbi:LarC family nickel insertion protein [Fuchsiella alkaliacetigena]|uniref:LarC family nickel insertion protein n=1 Tax=Fuchsiella alkaliacetigena TaxID=957042 RepID=UPI00200AB0FA|nr:LarC family nickel insertion protein [Fuchsiella alkaliacetigena]MCK8825109.1 LarC family nickel insertion protein [Fuchsiella alkaliacetigena]